ncbi:ABC transporter ATP-binding protein [Ornithinimicrobium tianjinense]|uniref:ABC transporter ATP-binding protein n=1 Tax=Ornithinimicrobium tianjinense TaxID=1195761 RepID=A0A917BSM8_9MICO|nr:ABC transporter ATP-binding protein [Ornithinimicrobium tianjinense]GGF54484.1 ABC transporter ATP-binding protein [Ornithinimicrobium tianjinense]
MSVVAQSLTSWVDGEAHLDDVTLTLEPGRIHTVLGRTGAGKTSLLRVLAGLSDVDSGDVLLDGRSLREVPPWRRETAMVYQQFINYPHLTALENVMFPLRRAKVPAAEAQRRAKEALEQVGLTHLSDRRPGALSGGQQQRVAIARALARRARILLLDEPLVNLDFKLREQLREELRGLFSGVGETVVVYTTTEPAEALMLGDEVIVMHEGRVAQVGSPAVIFETPATTAVARVVNDPPMNVIPGTLQGEHVAVRGLDLLPRASHLAGFADGPYLVGIPAPSLTFGTGPGVLATITFVEISGSETFVHVDLQGTELVVRAEGIHDVSTGDRVSMTVDPSRLFLFTEDGTLAAAPPHGRS